MPIFFSQSQLERVTEYPAGTTNDRSLLYKYWVSPMCAKLVSLLPTWVAPNLLTLIGWICTMTTFGLSAFFMSDMSNDAPRWVYFVMGFLIFAYMTLDNMDGKQAFRTGSSTPLGEALDHGVDSFSVGIIIAGSAAVTQTGVWWPIIALGPAMIAFYLAHWQEYFNHYLELGLLGPTEAEVIAALGYIVTGIFGTSMWTSVHSIFGWHFKFSMFVMLATIGAAIWTTLYGLYDGITRAKAKGVPLPRAISQLFPFSLSMVAGALFVWKTYRTYDAGYSFAYIATFNLLFSYLTILCIVQRICQLSFSYFYLPMLPLLVACFHSLIGSPLVTDESTIIVLLVFYIFNTSFFCFEIIYGFCKALNIKFLKIQYPNKATRQAEADMSRTINEESEVLLP
ncbi:hypothetical protein PROFUN_04281 [Planoprotostelium fungivorum]|uniref:CDP-alcohol phosphatidyltransferase n=1 Tax=Planoprotostelium fungivorum TaxID=1890364 RepID=A0A2P6NV08_9EUKA|nr:hypothetical protein PROFUN_04281 [Planoprotostelium fungivorum]